MKNNLVKLGMSGLAALTLLFSSCGENQMNINMEMEYADVTFTIPANSQTDTRVSTQKSVINKIDSVLKANNAKKEDISAIYLKDLTFQILDGDASTNFRVLESIEAEISSNEKPEFVRIGEVQNNPNIESYLMSVPVNNTVNYANYLNSNDFTFRVSGVSREPVKKDITVRAIFKFDIETKLK
jgi:hypothetical protein